jgi:hypothetical protein
MVQVPYEFWKMVQRPYECRFDRRRAPAPEAPAAIARPAPQSTPPDRSRRHRPPPGGLETPQVRQNASVVPLGAGLRL